MCVSRHQEETASASRLDQLRAMTRHLVTRQFKHVADRSIDNRARSQRLTATARKQRAAGRTLPRRKSKFADRTTNPQSVTVRTTISHGIECMTKGNF